MEWAPLNYCIALHRIALNPAVTNRGNAVCVTFDQFKIVCRAIERGDASGLRRAIIIPFTSIAADRIIPFTPDFTLREDLRINHLASLFTAKPNTAYSTSDTISGLAVLARARTTERSQARTARRSPGIWPTKRRELADFLARFSLSEILINEVFMLKQ